MIHTFDTDVANDIGVSEAAVFQNFVFWINKNEANEINFFDGKYWTFNSVLSYSKLFPYLTAKQIRRILGKLVDEKYLSSGCYNQNNYDRTKWYSFGEKGIRFSIKKNEENDRKLPQKEEKIIKKQDEIDQETGINLGKSICLDGQLYLPKQANRIGHKVEPIPDSKPYIIPDRKQKYINIKAEEKFNEKPVSDEIGDLPEIHVKSAQEYIFSFSKKEMSKSEIDMLWRFFKIENLTGERWYPNIQSIYTHFLRSLKYHKFNNTKENKFSGSSGFGAFKKIDERFLAGYKNKS